MDALRQWLGSIVVIILLGGFLEFILPEDGMRRYVRMVVNLLLVLAMVGPLVQFLRSESPESGWPAVVVPSGEQTAELVSAGVKMRQTAQNLFHTEGEQRLSRRVAEVAAMVPGVQKATAAVTIGTDGALEKVDVRISCGGDREAPTTAVRRTIAALLEIPPEQVHISPAQ